MGRSTEAVLVPFKMKSKDVQNIIERMSRDKYDDEIEATEYGWTFFWDAAEEYTYKKKTLYCHTLEKGELKIFVVNESEWAAGGDRDYCIFSKKENDILEFCKDFNIKPNITDADIVQQTM